MPYRSQSIKMYDPKNPEYSLVDAMTSERFTLYSPEVYWWSFIRDNEDGAAIRDELDRVYGEKSSTEKMAYLGPYEVKAAIELNPIVAEFTRLGLQQIEEVEAYVNIAAFDYYLKGRPPKPGDIFRVSWIVTETERRYVFYKVANVTPVDPYNFRYINFHLHAEQTTLHEAPDNIKQFATGM
jgi:coenzyme F420-reducing hydrogenase gamma subunit